jgi:uncharacterized protein
MRTRRTWIAVLGMELALAPLGGLTQAVAVSPSGTTTHEQAAPVVPAEDQASKDQLAQLFEVMRIRDQMQSVRKIVPALIENQIRAQIQAMTPSSAKLTASQRAQLQQLLHKYVEKAINLYSIDEMLDDMTGLYQEYLSREDVDAMIAFYKSDAGQHLLDAQPKIAQEYMPMVMRRAQERSQSLSAEMTRDLAALTQSNQAQPANK